MVCPLTRGPSLLIFAANDLAPHTGVAIANLILALASSLSLLLPLHAGLLVMLATTDLGQDATAGALALPTLESAFQGFVFSDSDFHFFSLPS